jgi:hypothetical protein
MSLTLWTLQTQKYSHRHPWNSITDIHILGMQSVCWLSAIKLAYNFAHIPQGLCREIGACFSCHIWIILQKIHGAKHLFLPRPKILKLFLCTQKGYYFYFLNEIVNFSIKDKVCQHTQNICTSFGGELVYLSLKLTRLIKNQNGSA